MKRLLIKLMLFSLPILIYILVGSSIDPYNVLHNYNTPKLIKLKAQIANKLNYPLYILPKYTENPTDIIVLGDSRSNFLNEMVIDSISKKKSTNLSFGGASLKEVIETFWYAANENKNLKEVYIGVSFMQYNKYNQRNRVTEAVQLTKAPLSYLFSNFCLKSTFFISKSMFSEEEINIGVPEGSKRDFWKYQLENDAVVSYYVKYQYPDYYHEELLKISNYCKNNNIKLVFFIPPTHIDLQEITGKFNRIKEDKKFIEDIGRLGLLYDFNYPNIITKDTANFKDPHHLDSKFIDILTAEIVTGNTKYARTYNNYLKE